MMSLTRDLILAVATEEASIACASLSDVLGMSFGATAKLARRRAIQRLIRETGCKPRELAKLWGCDPCVVFRCVHISTPPRSGYDASTAERLTWAHGPERAANIIAGTDPSSIADLAAWRSLGSAS